MHKDRSRINSILLFTEARCSQETCWSPRADVYHGAYGWFIKFDLAGVRPEDISVHYDGATLAIRGIRRDLFVEEDYNSYSLEISYSRFERKIKLSDEILPARVATEYRDGMLLVKVTTLRGDIHE